MCHRLTWRLQGFSPLGVRLRVDVTGDVVKGEEKVVLFVKLSRKLNLHLGTEQPQGEFSPEHPFHVLKPADDEQSIQFQVPFDF